MQPARMLRHMPIEHVEQRSRLRGRLHLRQDRHGGGTGWQSPWRPSLVQDSEQIADSLDLAHCRNSELKGKFSLDLEHQLGPAQAVDAQIPLESAFGTYVNLAAAFAEQLSH